MYAILMVSLIGIVPIHGCIYESHDLVEVNHFYDLGTGNLCFDQIIWYDWEDFENEDRNGRFQVVAWRLVKSPNILPYKTHDGYYRSLFFDGSDGKLRNITCRWIRESWTLYDPELVEREFLPKEQRRELRGFK